MNAPSEKDSATLLGNGRVIVAFRRLQREPNWERIARFLRNGQLKLDPSGQVRFRGDPLNVKRFERAL
jgi:hypothetical protein